MTAVAFPGLVAEGLSLVRGDRRLFSGLGFSLGAGELLLLHGPNGSGKSSLLRARLGLAPLAAGTLRLGGDARPLPPRALCGAALYQGHAGAAKAELTAAENLGLAASLDGTLPAAGVEGALDAALRALGLGRQRDLETRRLSQGQKQRLQLARFELALAAGGRPLWLMDEPSAALDAQGGGLLEGLLARHLARGGSAVVATHLAIAPPGTGVRVLRVDDHRPRRDAPSAAVPS